MSNTGDIINLVRDILLPLGVLIRKFGYKVGDKGTERIVLNSIPSIQMRAGSLKQNNDLVNVNLYVPKLNGGVDSERIDTLDGLIQTAINDFSDTTLRVGSYYLNIQPSQVFNEDEEESLINIRIETTYT